MTNDELKAKIAETMQVTYPIWVLWQDDHRIVMDFDKAAELIADRIRPKGETEKAKEVIEKLKAVLIKIDAMKALAELKELAAGFGIDVSD